MWHLALTLDEYFRKCWYPHLQWFQRSTDNCGKIHVRIILGHPIQNTCTCAALQPIKSYGAKYPMPRSTHLPSLVSLAQNFLASADPRLKKSDPGACSLHPTGTATTKAHRLRLYTCDHANLGSVGPPVWPARLAKSLYKPSRGGTCHVPRASCTPEKYKITRPPDGSIHPENLVRMHCTVFTPDSRKLDRQAEGREGQQKMPTYPPSINLRNTKNLHMLKPFIC